MSDRTYLETTLIMLYYQLDNAESIKDEIKRAKHCMKLNNWIEQVKIKLDKVLAA